MKSFGPGGFAVILGIFLYFALSAYGVQEAGIAIGGILILMGIAMLFSSFLHFMLKALAFIFILFILIVAFGSII